ncbi:hypothetical protein CDAR_101411 [Caerostris darwini]|uniref:Uncharacterized protein n=1 Tax=Caerostris darwini TaxID=1538125 RepID=A0AAV4W854_9ARAC|nr:hypothetical protein CDAR_101411 [Caerostris darwini]
MVYRITSLRNQNSTRHELRRVAVCAFLLADNLHDTRQIVDMDFIRKTPFYQRESSDALEIMEIEQYSHVDFTEVLATNRRIHRKRK